MALFSLLDQSPPVQTSYVIGNATIITGAFQTPLLDGAIVVTGSKITAVGSTTDVRKAHETLPFYDAKDFVVMPGLFNSHTHAPMGFFRGLGHGIENMIESFLFPAEKSLTPELLAPLSYSYIADGLRAGVTSFVDHYYFSEGIGRAVETFGVRGWIGETIADLGGAFPGSASFERAKTLIETSNYSTLVKHLLAPHATDTVSKPLLKQIVQYAEAQKLAIHMHLAQTKGETTRVKAREKLSPVQMANEAGALGVNSLVVHLTDVTNDDLAIVDKSKATIGWCPASTVIYDKLAPIKEFFAHKIPLAIGTDCAASNDSADILQELRTGYLFAKDRGVPLAEVSPDHLLAMATTNPARVLGVDATLGTIAAGKTADIIFLKRGLASEPLINILANAIFSMGARDVYHSLIDGKWRLWKRDFTGVSESSLLDEYHSAVKTIQARVAANKK